MKTFWTVLGVIILIAIIYFVYKNNSNKNKVAVAANNIATSNQMQTASTTPVRRISQTGNVTSYQGNLFPQSYINSFGGNPQLIRMVNAIQQARTYVFTCTKKNADGTTTTTSGYSSKPNGNCALGSLETIIKTI